MRGIAIREPVECAGRDDDGVVRAWQGPGERCGRPGEEEGGYREARTASAMRVLLKRRMAVFIPPRMTSVCRLAAAKVRG